MDPDRRVELVDLVDALPSSENAASEIPMAGETIWLLCFGKIASTCQVQSIFARFRHMSSPVVVVTPDVAPLRAMFGGTSIIYVQFTSKKSILMEDISRALREVEGPDLGVIIQQIGERSIVGKSPAFLQMMNDAELASQWDVPVIIEGETGTGKELVARAIHYKGSRRSKPFFPLDCGAIPLDLIENELFGHELGAYTGASTTHTGIIESAEGGTLFLDEINMLPLLAQAKILRLLQEHEYRPLGMSQMKSAKVRILAASHSDLRVAVKERTFREDLYYRLNLLTITVPPLRDRACDIGLLAEHYLTRYCAEHGRSLDGFSPEALRSLQAHNWPGNIRELDYAVHRGVLRCKGDTIDTADLEIPLATSSNNAGTFRAAKEQFERGYVKRSLIAHRGNIRRVSEASGLDRKSLYRMMTKYGLDLEQFRSESGPDEM
jgi:two-component system response regulator GlrR